MRIAPIFLSAALAALAGRAQAANTCEEMAGKTISLTGTALADTYDTERNSSNFLLTRTGAPCAVIDVTVPGALTCGTAGSVRVRGTLSYDERRIVPAHVDDARAACRRPPAAPAPAHTEWPARN